MEAQGDVKNIYITAETLVKLSCSYRFLPNVLSPIIEPTLHSTSATTNTSHGEGPTQADLNSINNQQATSHLEAATCPQAFHHHDNHDDDDDEYLTCPMAINSILRIEEMILGYDDSEDIDEEGHKEMDESSGDMDQDMTDSIADNTHQIKRRSSVGKSGPTYFGQFNLLNSMIITFFARKLRCESKKNSKG